MDLATQVTEVAQPVREFARLLFDIASSVYVVNRDLTDSRFTNEIRLSQTQVIAFRFERLPDCQRVRIYTQAGTLPRFRILILDWTHSRGGRAIMGSFVFENGTFMVSDFRTSLAQRQIPDFHNDAVLMIGLRFPYERFTPPIEARINMRTARIRLDNDGHWVEVTDTFGWIKSDGLYGTRVVADPPLLLRPRQRKFETYLSRTGVTVPTAAPIIITLTQEVRNPEFVPLAQAQADADARLQALMEADGFVETPEPMVPLILSQFAVRRRQHAIERRLRQLNQGRMVRDITEVPEFVPLSSPWMAYNIYMNFATRFPAVTILVILVTQAQTTATPTLEPIASTSTQATASIQEPIASTSATRDPTPETTEPETTEKPTLVPVITDTQLALVDTNVLKRRTHDSDVDREFRRMARISLETPATIIVPQTEITGTQVVLPATTCPEPRCEPESETNSSWGADSEPAATIESDSTPDSRECGVCDKPLNDTIEENEHKKEHVHRDDSPK